MLMLLLMLLMLFSCVAYVVNVAFGTNVGVVVDIIIVAGGA